MTHNKYNDTYLVFIKFCWQAICKNLFLSCSISFQILKACSRYLVGHTKDFRTRSCSSFFATKIILMVGKNIVKFTKQHETTVNIFNNKILLALKSHRNTKLKCVIPKNVFLRIHKD